MKTIKELKQQHYAIQEVLSYEYANRYAVEDCEEQLRPIVAKLRACHGLLSSMRKIPANVLARIFEFYLAPGGESACKKNLQRENSYMYYSYSDDECDDEDVEDRRPRLGLFCLVCRYWNTVATTTPSLLTTTSFVINAQEQKPGKYPLVKASHAHGISVSMDRVASRPWSLVINAYGRRDYWGGRSSSENSVELSKLLKGPALQHLQRVLIKADPLALGMGQVTLPSVSSIVICSDVHDEPVRNKKPKLPDLPSLPSLTQAVFEGVLPPRNLPLHIPWAQLTHLFLGETVPLRQWQAIFKFCTSLQKGCFDIFDYDPNDPKKTVVYPQPGTATLSHLTELVCIHVSPFGEERIQGVDMPSLKTMKLLLDLTPNCIWDLYTPNQFPSLTHLTLVTERLSGYIIREILKTVPQLQELFILISSEFDLLFDYLTFQPDNFNMPSLQALGLYIKTDNFNEVDTYDSDDDDEWEDDSEDGEGTTDFNFPYQSLSSFVASRTKAIQEGTFSASPQALSQLKQLAIHAANIRHQSHESIKTLEAAVAPFVSYGLNAFVFGAWPQNRPSGMRRMGGKAPSLFGRYKHWDEGFMEVVDGIEEYSLYPKSGQVGSR